MDLENAKQEFMKFTKKLDINKPKMERKIGHSIRVMENSKKIAESLNLSEEEIQVAGIIGLLHDIGKLEQINDEKYKVIEHGEFAVEILKNNNYIRKYIEDDKYDNVIFAAISNHGLFAIKEGLPERELMFAKIVRDADKLDIFYEATEMFWNTEEEKKNIGEAEISQYSLENLKANKVVSRKGGESLIDVVVAIISFIFDINFKYDFVAIKQEDYINRIINKFEFTNESTRKQVEEVRKIANEYILKMIQKECTDF